MQLPRGHFAKFRKNETERAFRPSLMMIRRRGHAAHGVEAILGKVDAMWPQDLKPSLVVGRHGVGQGSVAVEDESLSHSPVS